VFPFFSGLLPGAPYCGVKRAHHILPTDEGKPVNTGFQIVNTVLANVRIRIDQITVWTHGSAETNTGDTCLLDDFATFLEIKSFWVIHGNLYVVKPHFGDLRCQNFQFRRGQWSCPNPGVYSEFHMYPFLNLERILTEEP